MNKETLRMQMLAGIITESQYKLKLNECEHIIEGKLSPERKKRLDSLRIELMASLDPEFEQFDIEEEIREPDEILTDIRNEFGDVIASQIESGEYKSLHDMEDDDDYDLHLDKLADKIKYGVANYRVTKGGKMHKQDVEKMKNYYKNKREF